jgi:hypothetical protein
MRSSIVGIVLAIATPVGTIAAQQPAPAPSAPGTVVTSTYHAAGTQYGGWLMTAFDSIPAAKFSFKPTPAQMPIGEIAPHLENANYLLCERFSGMSHPMTARDSTADSLKALWPKDTLIARLKASFAFCDAAFAKVTDANLADTIAVTTPTGVRKIVRARLVLVFVMDLVDHYSQLANYMRLNGMIPPSSYPRPK